MLNMLWLEDKNMCFTVQFLMLPFSFLAYRQSYTPLLGPNKFEVVLMKILPKFVNLFELQLTCAISSEHALSFFTQLGTSCPKMKLLKLGSRSDPFPFFPQHQLALVLGERKKLLPAPIIEKFDRASHNRILFDSDHVTPICSSLQFLSIKSNYYDHGFYKRKSRFIPRFNWHKKLSFHSAIFLLRHFPQLQVLAARFHKCQIGDTFIDATTEEAKEEFLRESLLRPSRKVTEVSGVINDQGESVRLKWTVTAKY
jgi:hypothetical protein